jgi:hypothetical protein
VLHLPDVADLVRDEVVREISAAEEDQAVRREPVVTTPGRQAEEPWRDDDPDALDSNGTGPPVEMVEPLLRADEPWVGGAGSGAQAMIGSSTSTAERSCACVYWKL